MFWNLEPLYSDLLYAFLRMWLQHNLYYMYIAFNERQFKRDIKTQIIRTPKQKPRKLREIERKRETFFQFSRVFLAHQRELKNNFCKHRHSRSLSRDAINGL